MGIRKIFESDPKNHFYAKYILLLFQMLDASADDNIEIKLFEPFNLLVKSYKNVQPQYDIQGYKPYFSENQSQVVVWSRVMFLSAKKQYINRIMDKIDSIG